MYYVLKAKFGIIHADRYSLYIHACMQIVYEIRDQIFLWITNKVTIIMYAWYCMHAWLIKTSFDSQGKKCIINAVTSVSSPLVCKKTTWKFHRTQLISQDKKRQLRIHALNYFLASLLCPAASRPNTSRPAPGVHPIASRLLHSWSVTAYVYVL